MARTGGKRDVARVQAAAVGEQFVAVVEILAALADVGALVRAFQNGDVGFIGVFSCMTTVSAPSGKAAPVNMRAAWPWPTLPAKLQPAADSPTICNVAGTRAISAARTAYPSIDEASNGGWVSAEITGPASVRPAAARICTL